MTENTETENTELTPKQGCITLIIIILVTIFSIKYCDSDSDNKKLILKTENLVNNNYIIGCYQQNLKGGQTVTVKFLSNTRYSITKFVKGRGGCCTGYGEWSIKDNKVVLGSNSSGSESIQDYKGEYESYYFSCSGGYYRNCGGVSGDGC
jgi:hypothetical protein